MNMITFCIFISVIFLSYGTNFMGILINDNYIQSMKENSPWKDREV
jgi:hypothetical protein